MHGMDIRPAELRDATAIAAIYNHYVATTCITFETEPVPAEQMGERIAETTASRLPWLVVEEDGAVLGTRRSGRAAARIGTRWNRRCISIRPAKGRGLARRCTLR